MRRHPFVAALLSALIPGAGQWYARDPYRAAIVFSPAILVIAGTYGFASRGSFGMAELLVQPDFLTAMLAVNGFVLVWRIAASLDAYVLASRGSQRSTTALVGVAVMLGILAVPQVVGWVYGAATISTLNSVFVASPEDIDDPGRSTGTEPIHAANSTGLIDPAFVDIPEVPPASVRNLIFREGL